MQCEFERLRSRKIKFFPVMKVQAYHVRLDTTSLVQLYQKIFPQGINSEAINQLGKDINQLNKKNLLIESACDIAITNAMSQGMMDSEVKKAGRATAQKKELEIDQTEEAAQRARDEEKQATTQA